MLYVLIPIRDKGPNIERTGGMSLEQSKVLLFVTEETCRLSYQKRGEPALKADHHSVESSRHYRGFYLRVTS